MNITVNSQQLAAELRLLNKIVPTKPTIAILSHALLTADADGLRKAVEAPAAAGPRRLERSAKHDNWRRLARELTSLEAMAAHLDL